MEDRQRFAPTEVIPLPRRARTMPAEIDVLPDPGPPRPWVERSQLLAITSVVLVLLLLVLTMATLLPSSRRGTGSAAPVTPRQASDGDEALVDLERVSARDTQQLLTESGLKVRGAVEQSWTWTDRNGFNLATTSVLTKGPADRPRSLTLTVNHFANLDGRPRTLYTLRDAVDCDHRGSLRGGYTPASFRVSDLDGNGVAEVTAGWWYSCDDGQPDGTTVKLAVLSDGKKYIRRGSGPTVTGPAGRPAATPVAGPGDDPAGGPGDDPAGGPVDGPAGGPADEPAGPAGGPAAGQEHVLAPLDTFRAEPKQKRWPREFWDRSEELLVSLHGVG